MSSTIDALLDQLTLEEQVMLLAGRNMWFTESIQRLNIERLKVSDGPAGVRGARFDGPPSMNVPCGTAIAATWNRDLQRRLGELLGRENIAKGSRVHLAPTVNLHRTPVGGRNFECMSEDPYLTAMTAYEYVMGVQSQGVASCIKHLVGNDTEFERMTINSEIDERTLREMYLYPFEVAVKDANALSVMTSYNRINGPYAADSEWLLRDVLRGEWEFDGAVISDWFGLHSTVEAANAGLDLEMPGPSLHRGQKLIDAVYAGDVSPETIRERARNVLMLMERTGGVSAISPTETTRDDADDLALLREASAACLVLLKNEGDVLPLRPSQLQSIAVIGPNAATGMIMGGGSAHVTATRISHPLDAIEARWSAMCDIDFAPGCNINKKLPELDVRLVTNVSLDFFADPSLLDDVTAIPDQAGTTAAFHIMWFGDPMGRRGNAIGFGARFTMDFTPDVTGDWQFSIESVGDVVWMIDGEAILDNTGEPNGGSFFGMGKHEKVVAAFLESDRTYRMVLEQRHNPTGGSVTGINIGAMAPVIGDQVSDAVDTAARCDASILIVGTNDDWESEGWDRTDISLPGEQDRLIREVAKVSKRTIVVVNAGSPVAMPWLDEVDAVIYAWFPGQEMGDALVDVLQGVVEPSGRLPVTLPRAMEDTPAFEHHPGRHGVTKYLEGRLVGYRWYDTVGREPLFPFGFGLGYARVEILNAEVLHPYRIDVLLANNSQRDGVQVVQVYAHRIDRAGLPHDEPDQKLVGYARVDVAADLTTSVSVDLDPRAYRTWDTDRGQWAQWSGDIELRVGTSSRTITHRLHVTL